MTWTRIRNQLGGRGAIAVAGVAGFVLGAGGFAAVGPSAGAGITVPDSTVASTIVDLSVPAVSVATTDARPSSTVDAVRSRLHRTRLILRAALGAQAPAGACHE